jgi:hypothetical protein
MARGWESKSVDDQIAAAEAAAADEARAPADPAQQERETRKIGLQLARAKTLQDLQHACDRRHRATLERALEHLDAELATVTEKTGPP